MAGLQTQFEFTLPKGYVDDVGVLHRHGVMRLATARDEIEPLRSSAISGPDDPYLTVLVLARVVTELGSLRSITPDTIVGLFAADLAFLQDLYGIINFGDPADVAVLQATVTTPAPAPGAADHLDLTGPADSFPPADLDDASSAFSTAFDDERAIDAERGSQIRSRARVEEVRRATAP